MPDLNFTKAALEALPAPAAGKKARYSDTKVRALTIKVNPTGKRGFYHYRKVDGRPVETKLGDFPEMTIDQAGDVLIDMIENTANGRLTAAEALGHREFVMTKLYRSA